MKARRQRIRQHERSTKQNACNNKRNGNFDVETPMHDQIEKIIEGAAKEGYARTITQRACDNGVVQ